MMLKYPNGWYGRTQVNSPLPLPKGLYLRLQLVLSLQVKSRMSRICPAYAPHMSRICPALLIGRDIYGAYTEQIGEKPELGYTYP